MEKYIEKCKILSILRSQQHGFILAQQNILFDLFDCRSSVRDQNQKCEILVVNKNYTIQLSKLVILIGINIKRCH